MSQRSGTGRRFLVEATVKADTSARYRKAVADFVRWCQQRGLEAETDADLDELLTDYVHDIYETNDGGGMHQATCTMHGLIQLCPRLRQAMPVTAAALKGWKLLRPGESWPPITWELAVLVAATMARNGYGRHAVGCLLAFDCMLRVGELAALRKADVAVSGDPRVGAEYRGMSLRLRQTKTGPNQWVAVHDPAVQQLLLAVVHATSGDDELLFPFSTAEFRQVFKAVCASWHLSSRYVPHSLRHGGATRWSLLGHSVDDIKLRGRWRSTESARRYIQAGRAMLLSVQVPSGAVATARMLAADVALSLYMTLSQYHL